METWIKEIEIELENTSPKNFWTYCLKKLEEDGEDLTDWVCEFKEWSEPKNSIEHKVIKHKNGVVTACKLKPYETNIYCSGMINFIMEFDFYNDEQGYGYMYLANNI